MENLEFESSLTIGEIEENFKDVDCLSGIMKGLQEAMARSREKAAADDQSTKVNNGYYATARSSPACAVC